MCILMRWVRGPSQLDQLLLPRLCLMPFSRVLIFTVLILYWLRGNDYCPSCTINFFMIEYLIWWLAKIKIVRRCDVARMLRLHVVVSMCVDLLFG